ncbi:hypothetical protein BCR43DRAFT_247293 [Syncephalastrum racemosum]|uniref:Uncharacterized protein n=1 Tax=Syncephalastrum racemosum TaxID=13706 RepID=A0A1X2HFE8_SYNRA|nr:hypothetical protein BCR43DRAFT_247293 [Syncephalastrum racemosum]
MGGNNNKKPPAERRDSLKQQGQPHQGQQPSQSQASSNQPPQQQQRKSNPSGKQSSKHRGPTPPAHSSTPPTIPLTTHPTGQNGFNSAEVMQFLNQRYNNTATAYQEAPPAERPEKYESQEKAWGNKGSLPWGQKQGTMATGADFFTELCTKQQ